MKDNSIIADTAADLYQHAIQAVLVEGETTSPRGQKTSELTGVRLHLTNANENLIGLKERGLNYYFSVAEWLWILLGQNDVASVSRFNSKLADFSDDGVTFAGAYGPKWTEQLGYVINKLKVDPDSRQAVMTIWREKPGASKDVPCTVAFQFLLRNERVDMVTFMRSNDLWLGFPYDLFNFTQLQKYVAAALETDVGSYTHFVGSLHLYDRNADKADAAAVAPATRLTCGPLTYPYPLSIRSVFNELARPEVNRFNQRENKGEGLSAFLQNHVPEPWHQYMLVLADRTLDGVTLPEPWRELVRSHGIKMGRST